MKYSNAVLTIIALCLCIIACRELTPPANAEDTAPIKVILVDEFGHTIGTKSDINPLIVWVKNSASMR